MWLGYQKDVLALVADTKEELENTPMMTFTSIVETSDTYVLVNGQYVKEAEAATMPIAEPKTASAEFSAVPASATPEEVVNQLEAKYHMFRWEREAILAEGSQYSDFTKNIAQEIEGKAQVLRVADDAEEIAEAQQAEELAAQ